MRFHPANVEAKGSAISASSETYFKDVSVDDCVRSLRLHGIAQDFRLSEPVVDSILSYAQTVRFRIDGKDESVLVTAPWEARASGTTTSARTICTDVLGSKEIVSILRDRRIHEVSSQYLGYQPQVCEAYLENLFCRTSVPQGVDYRPYEYHYDIPGFGFIGFIFYLNAVDENNGAHVMIRKSHNKKPLRLLLRSGQSAGRQVHIYYDRDLELTVKGPKGHGFAEDLYAFHKVHQPLHEDRISLHIRYY